LTRFDLIEIEYRFFPSFRRQKHFPAGIRLEDNGGVYYDIKHLIIVFV